MIGIDGTAGPESDNIVVLGRWRLLHRPKPQRRQLDADAGQLLVGRLPERDGAALGVESADFLTDHRPDGRKVLVGEAGHAGLAEIGLATDGR